MLKLGSLVKTLQTGILTEGVIVGIYISYALGIMRGTTDPEENRKRHPRWTELYPKWDQDFVYVVAFSKPQKAFTLEECLSGGGTQENYDESAEQMMCTYPAEDLELLDEGPYVPANK
jgi:hypothetical protein